jgi:hypothetical protein
MTAATGLQAALLEKARTLAPVALEDLQSAPDDEDMQGGLRAQLQKALKDNETAQRELTALLEKIKAEKPEASISITDSKNVIAGSDIKVSGDFRLGDDVSNTQEIKDAGIVSNQGDVSLKGKNVAGRDIQIKKSK